MEKYDEISKIIKKIKFFGGRVNSNDKETKKEKLWLKNYIIQSLEDKYNSLNLTESDFNEIASDCQNNYVTFDLKDIKSKYVLKIFYNLLKISLSNCDKLWLLIRIRSDTKIKKLEKVLKKLSSSKIRTALSIIVDDDIDSEFEIGTIVVKIPVKNGVLVKCISSSKKIKISSDITEIDGFAFYLNNKVTEIDIPESVTKINNDAFYSCLKLEKIYISKNVKYIGKNVFLNCPNLKVIEIAKDNKFYYSEGNCIIKRKTKTLVAACEGSIIPNGIKKIDDYAFYGFSSLSEVTVPEGVTSIGRCFCSSCRNLKKSRYF